MKVHVDGATVELSKRHYIGQGGEGSVYAQGGTAYKIYADPRKMIPVAKIQELAEIKDPRVIRPLKVIRDGRGRARGYTMQYCQASFTLCQLFPRSFRDREHLDHKQVLHLVQELQAGVDSVHAAGVLIVDLNEMNFLVSKDFNKLYFIDADSYQTRSFHATALMESIRDRHMKSPHTFSTLTDWFAFGIVSFQLFCGIHPYKGKHAKLKGLDARMAANVSVFDPAVRAPKSAYPVDVIPQHYRDWYRAVFEDGVRAAPPTSAGSVVVLVPPTAIVGTNVLDIAEVFSFPAPIRGYWTAGSDWIVSTGVGTFVNKHKVPNFDKEVVAITHSKVKQTPVAVCGRAHPTLHRLVDQQQLPATLWPEESMQYDGRLYFKNRGQVYELLLSDAGAQTVVSTRLACMVMEKATKLFPGVVIQNMLGSTHVAVFPESGVTHQATLSELDGYRHVDAKYDRGVLVVIGERQGHYDRFVFRFSSDYRKHDCRTVSDVALTGINFVVLDSGVAVLLNEEDQLELFLAEMGSAKLKTVEDPVLGGDMTLIRHQGQLGFFRGSVLYSMRLRS